MTALKREDYPTLAHWLMARINAGEVVTLDAELLSGTLQQFNRLFGRYAVRVAVADGIVTLTRAQQEAA